MFSQTNYVEQDTARNHMALVKTNRVSKYTLFVQKYAIHNKYEGSGIIPSLF